MYSASKKIWDRIASHVEANKLNHNGDPLLGGNISPHNAQRILADWR